MSMGFSVLASGIAAAGAAATAKITANSRVKTASGSIGILTDIMSFPGPAVAGNWVVGGTRVTVMGMPTINQSGSGVSITAVGAPAGAMLVIIADSRARGM
jgi:hypothetical protein